MWSSPDRAPLAGVPTPRSPLAAVPRALALLVLSGSLGACSMFGGKSAGTPDNAPTIQALLKRQVTVAPDAGIPANEDKAIAAYRNFLAVTPDAKQRAEALRRLGDLSMASADNANAANPTPTGMPDYSAAIAQPDAPAGAWEQMGEFAQQEGRNADAANYLTTYLAHAPNAPDKALVQARITQLTQGGAQ